MDGSIFCANFDGIKSLSALTYLVEEARVKVSSFRQVAQ